MSKEQFLSNDANEKRHISSLIQNLTTENFSVDQAIEDADTEITEKSTIINSFYNFYTSL